MDKDDIRIIAERVFKKHVQKSKIIHVDVRPRIDHDEDRVVDVNIYYDGKYTELRDALMLVHSDIVSEVWGDVKEDLGFPLINFYS